MSCHGASHGLPTYTHQLLAWEVFRNVNLPITLHTLGPPRRAAPGQVAYRSLACQMYRRAMHTVLLAERAAVPAAPCRAVPHRAGRGGADPRTIYLFFPVYLSLSPMLCFLSHQWWRTDLCARTPRPCLCRDTPMLSHADPRRARAPGHAAGDKRRRLPAA